MNYYFKEACRLEKILAKEVNLPEERCENYRKNIEELYQKMR
jgi:hypothetical protein